MCLYSTLIFSFLLVSAVFANDNSPMYGGVQLSSSKNRTFHALTASLQVPILLGGPSDAVALSITLGGKPCTTDISLGVTCFMDLELGCHAWYHVLPNGVHRQLNDLSVHGGDNVTFGATAPTPNSTTGIHVFYDNLTTHDVRTLDITGSVICGRQASWQITNVRSQDAPGFHPVANFGSMSWTSVTAYSPTGAMYEPPNPGPHVWERNLNMSYPDGAILASVTPGPHSITFKYVGN